ncbi:hypothetical protein ABIA35_004180 [Catenulispora sp. MAP12-49]|uniref:hypothetical protein n=1 Tax=Catenulispora sp. MAP12-49 TaxID=3156302 RepID=UPI003515376A
MTAMLLPRENARFMLGPMPLLVLADAPMHAEFPELASLDGLLPTCDGWTLMAGFSVCVLDGADGGCLIPTMGQPDGVQGAVAWRDAVEQNGGAVVVSLPAIPDEFDWDAIFGGGWRARGGFVRGLGVNE